MKKIALLTSNEVPNLIEDEQELLALLRSHNILVDVLIWDESYQLLHNYDLIVVRSIWDYHLKYDEFIYLLDYAKDNNIKLLNDPYSMYTNSNKIYLKDLAEKDIPILPSEFVLNNHELKHAIANCIYRWDKVVVKPCISASAYQTFVLEKDDLTVRMIEIQKAFSSNEQLIIQKFYPEISNGEYSFIFFNKKYSHCMLKKPKKGDFRVQNEFGGSSEEVKIDMNFVHQASIALDFFHEDLLYTRVDAVIENEKLIIMEIELIEPDLFLIDSKKRNRFANAILKHLEDD